MRRIRKEIWFQKVFKARRDCDRFFIVALFVFFFRERFEYFANYNNQNRGNLLINSNMNEVLL